MALKTIIIMIAIIVLGHVVLPIHVRELILVLAMEQELFIMAIVGVVIGLVGSDLYTYILIVSNIVLTQEKVLL